MRLKLGRHIVGGIEASEESYEVDKFYMVRFRDFNNGWQDKELKFVSSDDVGLGKFKGVGYLYPDEAVIQNITKNVMKQ